MVLRISFPDHLFQVDAAKMFLNLFLEQCYSQDTKVRAADYVEHFQPRG